MTTYLAYLDPVVDLVADMVGGTADYPTVFEDFLPLPINNVRK